MYLWISLTIIYLTYLGIALGGFPRLRTNRTTVAAASPLAVNPTLLGSVANLIVAEVAARHKAWLGFWEYTLAGVPITRVSLILGGLWLQLVI